MKRNLAAALSAALLISLVGCGGNTASSSGSQSAEQDEHALVLSDDRITLDGEAVSSDTGGAVTSGHDIIYYEAGHGEDYGAGSGDEAHTAEEAAANTVVTIREAGVYRVSGTLSAGQLAIDLGDDAKTDPEAVVTLVLDGVDITCDVAPAVIFYNVYECDADWVAHDEDESVNYVSTSSVSTQDAGANVVLADGSTNNITGSHVAKIYQEGTEKKLHKYDGAFYSKMSMNLNGESQGTGVLNIVADNEGLDSELHLTVNGGSISIQSQNDGINTNEDGVSVTTINGGTLKINAGLGAEGDGIDSNGYLVINGGNVYTMANEQSPDGGLDADGDILINGGYVVSTGVRNDQVSSDSAQQYMTLNFASSIPAGSAIELKDGDGKALLSFTTEKACQSVIFSSPDLTQDVAYTLTVDGVTQAYYATASGGPGGAPNGNAPQGEPPQSGDGQTPPEKPEGDSSQTPPDLPDGQAPDNTDGTRPQPPQGGPNANQQPAEPTGEGSSEFTLMGDTHTFSQIAGA